jgi:hypothetical protein
LNFTPANANDTLVFDLQVCDKDGGCSSVSSTTITTRAQSPNTISGVVTDASNGNAPLASATVALFNSAGLVGTTSTNGSGQYSFGGLANGTDYIVNASKTGYDTVYFSSTQSAGGAKRLTANGSTGRSDIDIALDTTANLGSISGNVVDSSFAAISGVGTRLYDENGFVATTTTDGSGNFSFSNLAPKSTYKVRYNCSSGCGVPLPYVDTWHLAALTGNEALLITVSAGANTPIATATLYRTSGPNERATISGTVTDGTNPLQTVQVRVYDFTTGAWITSANTNASGNYSISVLPGSFLVWFWTKNTALVPPPPVATQARTSQWADGLGGFLNGEQGQGTAKPVSTAIPLAPSGSITLSPALP